MSWGLSDLNLTVPRTGDRDPHDPRSLWKARADTRRQPVDGNLTGKLLIVRCIAFSLEEHLLSVWAGLQVQRSCFPSGVVISAIDPGMHFHFFSVSLN